jgi:hypothetical protein
MFVGHYGVAFAAKAADDRIPLWLLFVAVQLPDIVWGAFILLGRALTTMPPIRGVNPLDQYYIQSSHGIAAGFLCAGALVVYLLANGGAPRFFKASLLLGLAVASHWALDYLVHPPEILRHLSFKSAFYDFGLPTFLLELGVLFGGIYMYLRSTASNSAEGKYGPAFFGIGMVLLQLPIFLGPSPKSDEAAASIALGCYAAFLPFARWVERERFASRKGRQSLAA